MSQGDSISGHRLRSRYTQSALTQSLRQDIEDEADTAAGVKLPMGHEPNRDGDGIEVRQNALDARRLVCHVLRHNADSQSVLDHFPGHCAVLRGQPEIVLLERESHLVQTGQQPARAVKSDENGLGQVAERTGAAQAKTTG